MQARYLRPAKQMPEIYLYRVPVDFRKHIERQLSWPVVLPH